MYPPPHHQCDNKEAMIAVIRSCPLALLVTASKDKPLITHLPVMYREETEVLIAHIDAANPQTADLIDGKEVTVVFRGPDTYISPSVYTTPQLPTWNYLIVHLTGTVSRMKTGQELKESLVNMTHYMEGEAHRFRLDYDDPRMERLLPHILGFNIDITHWEGKFKLSQDKIPADFERARQVLIENSKASVSELIHKIYKHL